MKALLLSFVYFNVTFIAITQDIETTQWEFCECVVQNDSINHVVEHSIEGADWDSILMRMDQIDSNCRKVLTVPLTSLKARELHVAKVRKCLGIIE
jgi:hypothetical protein